MLGYDRTIKRSNTLGLLGKKAEERRKGQIKAESFPMILSMIIGGLGIFVQT